MDVMSHYGHVTSKTPIHQASLFLLASERSSNLKPTAWLKIQISTLKSKKQEVLKLIQ